MTNGSVKPFYKNIEFLNYIFIDQEINDDEWDNIFAVNVKGCFNCSKAALLYMINEHKGSIVNISSIWGIAGASCEVAYSATKSAVIGFTKALAKEVGPSGIRVNCVAPGVIDTDMNAHLNESDINALKEETPLGVIGTPSNVAETVIYLAEADFVTGQVISPNGGMVI
jgi:3-oxoacyl-[acyl-carrier protein] reductase